MVPPVHNLFTAGDKPSANVLLPQDVPQDAQRGVAESLSTSRMTQQEGQQETDRQEDRNGWFVNWNRPG